LALPNHLRVQGPTSSESRKTLHEQVKKISKAFVPSVADDKFTDYYMTYLGEMLLAIHEDKLPIAGAFAWCKLH